MSSSPLAKTEAFDVAVIGGGLAGGLSAFHLAYRGIRTVLLEKEPAPHHKVCGDFLSGEGLILLKEMGVDPLQLGGVLIHGFRLHGPKRTCESTLPVPAYGISRKVLDEAVLRRAETAGAEVRRGVLAKEILEGLDGSYGSILLETSERVFRAQRLVVATGKSEFKSAQKRMGRDSDLVGFKMHLRLKPSEYRRIRDHVDLFVFEHGYGGLSPVEGGLANFCFLMEKSVVRSLGKDWNSLASYIAHHNIAASHYLDGAEPQFKNFVAVANIPYGFLRRDPAEPGVYCVGDQMAVIPSLTGDGMNIALMTGRHAASAIADSRVRGRLRPSITSQIYQNQMRRRLRKQVEIGFHIHQLFKNPSFIDGLAVAIRYFPGLIEFVYNQTRCPIPAPSGGERVVSGVRPSLDLISDPGQS